MNRFSARARLGMVLIGLAVGLTALRPAAAQQNRIALLIGNAAYADAPLKNPAKDARDMADVLQQLGFEVMLTTDADRRQIIDAIRAFGQRMTGSSVALFYYSGHGLQYRGQNYLMPLNAQIQSETDIEFEMVDVDRLLAEMDAANRRGVNLVIFDACRVNPVKGFLKGLPDGLAQMAAPTGSLIAYASAPGTPSRDDLNGDNSVYTRRLLEALRAMPSEDIYKLLVWVRRQVMADTGEQQVPWEASSLTGTFAFTAQQSSEDCWANETPGAACAEPTTGMEFVYVPGGCFQMGQTEAEKAQLIKEVGEKNYASWFADELPRHKVCLQSFWMGKYEVTNAQYRQFKANHDSQSYEGKSLNGDDQPVVMVSWNDAQALTAWLTKQGRGEFRLPTEAEWEYAARGGAETIRFWGDDSKHAQACQYANVGDASFVEAFPTRFEQWKKDYNWFAHACDDGYAVTAPVGQFEPNAFGLYDMLGNVWEWQSDTYHDNYTGAPTDGSAWEQGGDVSYRLLRGGSWGAPYYVRRANRLRNAPGSQNYVIGIRLVFSRTP